MGDGSAPTGSRWARQVRLQHWQWHLRRRLTWSSTRVSSTSEAATRSTSTTPTFRPTASSQACTPQQPVPLPAMVHTRTSPRFMTFLPSPAMRRSRRSSRSTRATSLLCQQARPTSSTASTTPLTAELKATRPGVCVDCQNHGQTSTLQKKKKKKKNAASFTPHQKKKKKKKKS